MHLIYYSLPELLKLRTNNPCMNFYPFLIRNPTNKPIYKYHTHVFFKTYKTCIDICITSIVLISYYIKNHQYLLNRFDEKFSSNTLIKNGYTSLPVFESQVKGLNPTTFFLILSQDNNLQFNGYQLFISVEFVFRYL